VEAEVQKMKETAIVGMHNCFKANSEESIKILIDFTVNSNLSHQVPAYWALKDYLLLYAERENNIDWIVEAFVVGSVSSSEEI